ncbi:MAG: UbiX family flavin prenyltransferase [Flavobacteriales bacterium]|nr:UbiX family flavin prenyltransferase [Flavobacteriales bacterium]
MGKKKIVIGITGASGAAYARLLLQQLEGMKDQIETAGIVASDSARVVWQEELGESFPKETAFPLYTKDNFHAPFASGSAGYDAMIICPCSMGTLGRIASGISNDLMTRAADVMLKERRKLILVARETPYNLIHIRNMETVTLAGGIICPASPSLYSQPENIEQLLSTVTHRALALAGLEPGGFRWGRQ